MQGTTCDHHVGTLAFRFERLSVFGPFHGATGKSHATKLSETPSTRPADTQHVGGVTPRIAVIARSLCAGKMHSCTPKEKICPR